MAYAGLVPRECSSGSRPADIEAAVQILARQYLTAVDALQIAAAKPAEGGLRAATRRWVR